MTWLRILPLGVLALAAQGCIVEHDPDDGVLTVEWSVDDSFDPDACRDFDARTFELVVYDWDGHVAGDVHAPCDDFSLSLDLEDGTYSIDVTLLDGSDRKVTTTLPLDDVDIYAGDETVIPVDFPVDSLR